MFNRLKLRIAFKKRYGKAGKKYYHAFLEYRKHKIKNNEVKSNKHV
ncbi:MAG: hypothetical protein MUO82_10860 [Candidatus Thermoplasmatota archaeon]|nr:hypothetical protein [Candidatus Thermoplasmatota archaeon]